MSILSPFVRQLKMIWIWGPSVFGNCSSSGYSSSSLRRIASHGNQRSIVSETCCIWGSSSPYIWCGAPLKGCLFPSPRHCHDSWQFSPQIQKLHSRNHSVICTLIMFFKKCRIVEFLPVFYLHHHNLSGLPPVLCMPDNAASSSVK